MLKQQNAQLTSQEWIGFYKRAEDALLEWVICVNYLKEYRPGTIQFSAKFVNILPKSTLGSQYYTLTNTKNAIPPMVFDG